MSQPLAGRYQIERELGRGGFGITYLARDLHLPGHPLCVVKQLKPQFNDPKQLDTAKRLFETEAKTLQQLGQHPQIPQLLAYFTQGEEFYLVQDYIQGHELSEEIQPGKPWSEEQVIQLLQDILTPLTFLHQNGVIHRDIKPDNLMRRKDDRKLVLIDFGAVKQELSQLTRLRGSTQLTVAVGTPEYMPSEQSQGRPKLCSDIYAVGIIAIEALTGKASDLLSFDEDLEVIWQPFASHASPGLQRVLQRMIWYHFKDRYASAEEVLEEVKTLQNPTAPTQVIGKAQPKPGTPNPVHLTLLCVDQSPQTSLAKFQFEVLTVNRRGKVVKRENREAQYYREDLGEGIGLDMVAIPGGKFLMGSPEGEGHDSEKPQHSVTMPPFYMGKFLITQAQWLRVALFPQVNRALPFSPSDVEGDNLPVEQVSWYDCEEFCSRLSQYAGKSYRLPSEAEWEYVCRARTATPFHFGETLTTKFANFDRSSYTYADEPEGKRRQKTTPVGSFPPNGFGLYDMHGNLWEWCTDDYHEDYRNAPIDGSTWLDSDSIYRKVLTGLFGGDKSTKVLRGGSWSNCLSRTCRCASRKNYNPDNRGGFIGLRVVLPLVSEGFIP
ncbi:MULTISPECIES: bifunctional serine/threonine-protein kinase/formylglycine-generating enzyme family protein [unclassified Roseofilum]|uniref:bifunctional serine/threonine-protein kinase/formylglycine-generating enzyme family protein n=1 Tax=unclassified Roseofilum TaxID=2620099 RepID=UPI001B193A9A|nr:MULTISPECIES: bifunctional serine/threonine-protein kinase/formylglycine-generating enzyme family protein [unclassified Roseofilum]MBP0007768.1 SUMF1/EgtB/PvdO family nonheme iron enzyme [Roseofilum sp. Belize Diploria]MBP0032161.1 SUMF1/EgtB/PvdO family nonheme iron enzyme [Roseofilum sp. Belize BBD 4]